MDGTSRDTRVDEMLTTEGRTLATTSGSEPLLVRVNSGCMSCAVAARGEVPSEWVALAAWVQPQVATIATAETLVRQFMFRMDREREQVFKHSRVCVGNNLLSVVHTAEMKRGLHRTLGPAFAGVHRRQWP